MNLEVQSWENINDVIRTKVQSDQAPDILNIDSFAGFVEDDLLYAADEVLSEETIADFQESFVQNATMDGKQYGFPFIASARASAPFTATGALFGKRSASPIRSSSSMRRATAYY